LQILDREIWQEKEIKGIQIGKEEIKLYLFVDGMMLYVENPEDSIHKKVLEQINKFNKVTKIQNQHVNNDRTLTH
jgi:hypothetical protein